LRQPIHPEFGQGDRQRSAFFGALQRIVRFRRFARVRDGECDVLSAQAGSRRDLHMRIRPIVGHFADTDELLLKIERDDPGSRHAVQIDPARLLQRVDCTLQLGKIELARRIGDRAQVIRLDRLYDAVQRIAGDDILVGRLRRNLHKLGGQLHPKVGIAFEQEAAAKARYRRRTGAGPFRKLRDAEMDDFGSMLQHVLRELLLFAMKGGLFLANRLQNVGNGGSPRFIVNLFTYISQYEENNLHIHHIEFGPRIQYPSSRIQHFLYGGKRLFS